MKAISPENADKAKKIPDFVIEAFNELIAKRFDGNSSTVMQNEVVDLILVKGDCTRQQVFNEHWLDVKGAFMRAGWTVKYDKPGYCESYEASFEFKKKAR